MPFYKLKCEPCIEINSFSSIPTLKCVIKEKNEQIDSNYGNDSASSSHHIIILNGLVRSDLRPDPSKNGYQATAKWTPIDLNRLGQISTSD